MEEEAAAKTKQAKKTKKEKAPETAGLSFIRLLKDIYKEEMQLNIGESFVIWSKAGETFVSFPDLGKMSSVFGKIDLSEAKEISDWISEKDCQVTFQNKDIDELRKAKISSFAKTSINGDDLSIVTSNDDGTETERTFAREALSQKYLGIDDPEYRISISPGSLDDPMLNVYKKKGEPSLTFDKDESESTIVNIPTKSVLIAMKKEADYELSVGKTDPESSSRLVMLSAKAKRLQMRQCFRVIEF